MPVLCSEQHCPPKLFQKQLSAGKKRDASNNPSLNYYGKRKKDYNAKNQELIAIISTVTTALTTSNK